MNYKLICGTFESSSGIADIAYYIYEPLCEIKAVMQLSHGMCEYIRRYDDFADYLCKNGFLVCGNDHLGHGSSVNELSELGYFGKKNGYTYMVRDLYSLTEIVKTAYSGVPFFLMGHSMGSFLARLYLAEFHSGIDAAVITGTGGGVPGVPFMKAFLFFMKKLYGEHHRSRLISDCAAKLYTAKIKSKRTPCDWISRDITTVDKFISDKYCNFIFTLNGYEQLALMQRDANSRECAEKTPDNLPMLFTSGGMDPVGDYSKGVTRCVKRYRKHGCDNISVKLYDGARHEIINEVNKAEVYGDILSFLLQNLPK